MQNPQSNVSKNIKASYATYDSDVLDNVYENHRGGMILTSTLWRIRQKIGQKKTDSLVAQTILELNNFMNDRNKFYKQDCSTPLPYEIEWYDVFWGLIQKDKELNQGDNVSVIIHEFEETGYPAQDITF
jgi:carbonic anhydrase